MTLYTRLGKYRRETIAKSIVDRKMLSWGNCCRYIFQFCVTKLIFKELQKIYIFLPFCFLKFALYTYIVM